MKNQFNEKVGHPENQFIYEEFKKELEKAKSNNNNHQYLTYRKLLHNIQKFPLPIINGSMAQKYLAGIGEKLASKVDRIIKQNQKGAKRKFEDYEENKAKRIPKQQTQTIISQIQEQQPIAKEHLMANESTLKFLYEKKYIENNEENKIVCTQKGQNVSQAIQKQIEINCDFQNVDLTNFKPDDILKDNCKSESTQQTLFQFTKDFFNENNSISLNPTIQKFEVQLIVDSNERLQNDFNSLQQNLGTFITVNRQRLGIGDYH